MANPFPLIKRLATQMAKKASVREADEILQGLPSTIRNSTPKAAMEAEDAILVDAIKSGQNPLRKYLAPIAGAGIGTALIAGARPEDETATATGSFELPEDVQSPSAGPALQERMPAKEEAPSAVEQALASQLKFENRAKSLGPMPVEGSNLGTQENFQAAQKTAQDAAQRSRMGQIGELLGTSISGAKPVATDIFKQQAKDAESAVTDFKDLVKNERNDPGSAYSRGLKAYMQRAGLDIQGDMSAEALEKIMPFAVRQYEADLERELRKQSLQMRLAEAKDLRKEKSEEKKKTEASKTTLKLFDAANKQTKQLQDTFDERVNLEQFLEEAKNAPSGKGFQDVAIKYGFIKSRDNTAVREGEQRILDSSGSITDQMRRTFNRAIKGEAFNREDMEALQQVLRRETQQQANAYKKRIDPIKSLAEKQGGNAEDVISRPDIYNYAAQAPAGAPKVKIQDTSTGKVKQFDAEAAKKLLANPKYKKVD